MTMQGWAHVTKGKSTPLPIGGFHHFKWVCINCFLTFLNGSRDQAAYIIFYSRDRMCKSKMQLPASMLDKNLLYEKKEM